MGGSSSQTIGYHYLFDILFGVGRGPINELVEIKVGDKTAWTGSVKTNGQISINKPNLFGGEKKEGGIQGPLYVHMGADNQVLPTVYPAVNLGKPAETEQLRNLKTAVGDLCSDMRGVVTFWFTGLISSMNPYPKEWKFRLRRHDAGWDGDCWYPAKALISLNGGAIQAMNGAHIIYECLTNREWGRGMPRSLVNGDDGGSFVEAANILCGENFGLCFAWQRKDDIDTFINMVLDHIGGVLYLNRRTGKMDLRLIRNNYDPAELPVFTPSSGLLEITEDDSSSQDTAFNEVIATGHDPITDTDIQVRVHNLAARHSQGAANTDDKGYPGVPTKDLLLRLAQRDLRVHASGLKKFNVTLDRRGWQLTPGAPFRIQDPRRGIADIILRVGEVQDGTLKNGRVTVKAIQDVYGMPEVSFVVPTDGTWTPPPTEAAPASESRLIEAGYRDIFLKLGTSATNELALTDSFIGVMGLAPNSTTLDFELRTRVAGEPTFEPRGTGSFTGSATLAAAIKPLDTTFVVAAASSFDSGNVGQAIMLEDELMRLTAFDAATQTATVERGVADTIPAAHPLGARIWTIDDDLATDGREYLDGETVEAKLLTRTSSDLLSESEADTETVVLDARQARPYPPGDVKVDGVSAFLLIASKGYATPVLTWAHRDRKMQADQLVPHTAASFGPEPGTTYNIRVYGADGTTLLRTVEGLTEPTWTYDAEMQGIDGAPVKVYIELESERDELASWQKYRFQVTLKSGYGYGYGLNYGGA